MHILRQGVPQILESQAIKQNLFLYLSDFN